MGGQVASHPVSRAGQQQAKVRTVQQPLRLHVFARSGIFLEGRRHRGPVHDVVSDGGIARGKGRPDALPPHLRAEGHRHDLQVSPGNLAREEEGQAVEELAAGGGVLVEGGGGGGTLGRARGVQSRSGAAAVAIAAALLFAVAAVVGRSALLARRVVLVRLKLLDSLVRTMLFAGLTLGLCFGDRGVFDLEGGGRVPLRGFRGGVGVKISLLAVGVRLRPSRGEG
mmetsp:Transcript_33034/g.76134  ORF Transcript_33034/g.76134 Transcript_33034/m.76134 type:complete len:225 (+) Transcript_33034:756-1430(+)